jgi:glycine cleavage system aminomethyltransferase T
VADVTVTRLAEQRFRVITGAGVVESDMGWLRLHQHRDDGAVALRELTGRLAVIGIWGPRARDVVSACSDDDVSDSALPFRRACEIRIGTPVLAQRITYVGELGFELYVDPADAVQVWDRLARRAASTASASPDTARWTGFGSRRAIATWAPT